MQNLDFKKLKHYYMDIKDSTKGHWTKYPERDYYFE